MSNEKTYFVTDGKHWAFHTGNGRYGRWSKVPKHQAMPYTREEAHLLKTQFEIMGAENAQILTFEEWRQFGEEGE